MPDLRLCTPQDVIDFFSGGDEAPLRQLTGGTTGTLDRAKLDKAILTASADVEASGANKFDLRYNVDPTTYPMFVRRLTADRSVYYLWKMYSRGQAMPANVLQIYQQTSEELTKLEDGKKGIGQAKAQPARVFGYVTTDLTSGGTVPRMSLEGFRRGFM